jgi:hypothetical protein
LDQVRLLQSLSNLNKTRLYAAFGVSPEAVFLYTKSMNFVIGSNLALIFWGTSENIMDSDRKKRVLN